MTYLVRLFASLVLAAPSLAQANIVIVNNDSAGEGFNDATSVSAVGGNPATALGQQRLNVFQRAADILNNTFDIAVTVRVGSSFDPLTCSSGSAVLGQAGPAAFDYNFSTRTITPHALYNQQVGYDADTGTVEINAQFNSSIDNNDNCLFNTNWYYGYDAPSGNDNSLLSVVLHEILHGMGFLSTLQSDGNSGGGWSTLEGFVEGFDPYTYKLKDASTGQMLTDQAAGTRSNVMRSGTNLVWSGTEANAESGNYSSGINSGEVQMYAPGSYKPGSSVSHFDTAMTPNELMEPQYTEFLDTAGLAEQLLVDIGWSYNAANAPNSPPSLSVIGNRSLSEDGSLNVALSATDADADSLTYSLGANSAALGASISGTTLNINPTADFNGSGTLTVNVTDGEDTDSETITVTVTPVNDTPVLASIGTQTVNEESSTSVTLSASDVDGDSLTYQLDSATAALGASVSGNTLSINPTTDFTGSGSVTVSVSDGSLSDSETFTVTVNNINDAPVLSAVSDLTIPEDTSTTITLTATDIDGDSLTFSAVSADTGVATVAVSGSTLTVTAATANSATTTITVTVSDGTLSADTSFSVELTDPSAVPPITMTLGGVSINDGATYEAPLGALTVTPAGGTGNYTISAFFNGEDGSELISNGSLLMPDSGAFAGVYTLDVSDGSGNTATFYVERPLRLTASVDPLLQSTDSASLYIEGASAAATISLSATGGISFTDTTGAALTSIDAPDSTADFNRASVGLSLSAILNGTVTATASNIPDSELNLSIVASRTVTITVRDDSGRPVAGADITITDERVEGWGLDADSETDANGRATITLPATAVDIEIDGDEFSSEELQVPANTNAVSVTLEPAAVSYTLTGLIQAQGFNFDSELPEVRINLSDGSQSLADLNELSNTRVEYEWTSTLGSALPESMTVDHSALPPVTVNLNPAASSEIVDITLITEADDDSATGAGAVGIWATLILLGLRRRLLSPRAA
ncbi:tandem-95 repeat protein [Thalassolituus sp.]|uniref:tandem-95 repeat protein n=1 Tax=Thalassolituus sp. TaxID=2030822 RepID=UPI0027D54FC4|nr:tandem-95 repeat protein [Thalassolituus sp.]MDQ4427230.1 tandem-95 repeat protein [Thalassolituus sp.]